MPGAVWYEAPQAGGTLTWRFEPGALFGKRTLAVRLGRERTRRLYVGLIASAYLALLVTLAAEGGPWEAALALLSLALVPAAARPVLSRTDGPALNVAQAKTGALLALFGLALSAGLLVAA